MSLLSRDRYDSGVATLRRIADEGIGYVCTEIDVPAVELHGEAVRVATLYIQGGLGMRDVIRLVAEARDLRARLVMDREGDDHTIRITIARALDSAEEAALAARIQADARMGGAA